MSVTQLLFRSARHGIHREKRSLHARRQTPNRVWLEPLEARVLLSSYNIADYFPLTTGTTWSYAGTQDGNTATQTIVASKNVTVGAASTTELDSTLVSSGKTYHDNRLWSADSTGLMLYQIDASDTNGTSSRVFSPPVLLADGTVSDGQVIDFSTSYTISGKLSGVSFSNPGTWTGTTTINGTVTVITPDGTFSALSITIAGHFSDSGESGNYTDNLWLGRGVGIVKENNTTSDTVEGKLTTTTDDLSLTASSLVPPVIGGGLTASPNPVTRGNKIMLTASNLSGGTGGITGVTFALDLNHDGVIDAGDKILGAGKRVNRTTSNWQLITSTVKFALGSDTVLAVATDKTKVKSAPVSTTLTVDDHPPTLAKLTVSEKAVANGNPFTLKTAGVADPDGKVVEVEFFLDANGTGIPDPADELGEDTSAAGGWNLTITNPTGLPTSGTVRFLAVAIDNDGASSAVATVTVNADAPPTIGTFTGLPSPVVRGSDLTLTAGNLSGTIKDVAFWFDANDDGVIDSRDKLLGKGKLVNGSYVLTGKVPDSTPAGSQDFIAVATDSNGFLSAPIVTTVTIS